MKKKLYAGGLAAIMAIAFLGCKKTVNKPDDTSMLQDDEKALIAAAGFNSDWAEKRPDGNFLIEGDILLTRPQLQELSGKSPVHELIIANEEHYRTTFIVSTPSSGTRTITVSIDPGFPSYYYTGLDASLERYNSLALKINFIRVSSGGDIHISGEDLGTSGNFCILGQAAGFPNGSGKPARGFTLSTSSCAIGFLSSSRKVDEVIAHEMGHCIGFRHTDFMNRASCGQNINEGTAGIGAIHIPGTPTIVSGNYKSWMMACADGIPNLSQTDQYALQFVY